MNKKIHWQSFIAFDVIILPSHELSLFSTETPTLHSYTRTKLQQSKAQEKFAMTLITSTLNYAAKHLRGTLELANNKLGTQALHTGISGVRKVSSVDTLAMSGVANTISVSTDIKSSGDPARGDAVGASVL